jgi:hypothetical protein
MSEQAGPERSFLVTFVLLGLGINAACIALWLIGDLIWVDFLHTNPNRTQSNALTVIALSPLYGLFGAVFGSALPILCGSITLTIGGRFYRRIPAWLFVLSAPICGMAAAIQIHWVQAYFGDGPTAFWMAASGLIVLQVPFLLTCWWWTQRQRHEFQQ